jgi:phosphate transport system permease protein
MANSASIEHPVKSRGSLRSTIARDGDFFFKWFTVICATALLALLMGIFAILVMRSSLSIRDLGWSFLFSQEWNPVIGEFGALSSIYGTIVSTIIAMLLAVPLSLVTALFLVELAPAGLSHIVGGAIELLAAIPSIIYGMWGLFVFAPFMADYVQPFLGKTLGWLPLFQGPPMGIGMLTAGLILTLMILPFITAIARDVFRMVPAVVKEAGYGVGATTWEVTRKVTIRYGARGIVGGVFLGLGRALGETMAVTFVIGNDHTISPSLFMPANSITSTLANEFTEASEPLYLSALIELGLILFVMTVVVQLLAQLWLRHMEKTAGGGL